MLNARTSAFTEAKSIVLAHELGHQLGNAADSYSLKYWLHYLLKQGLPSNPWPGYVGNAIGPGMVCDKTSKQDPLTCQENWFYIITEKNGIVETFVERENTFEDKINELLNSGYSVRVVEETISCCGPMLSEKKAKDNMYNTCIMGNFTETNSRLLTHPKAYEQVVYNAFKENLKRKGYCGKVDYGIDKLGYYNAS